MKPTNTPDYKTITRFFWQQRGTRLWTVTALLIASNLSEMIGISALLPVLLIATKGQNPASGTDNDFSHFLDMLGIPTELGPLLCVLVIAILLKAVLKYFAILEATYLSSRIAKDMRLKLINTLANAKWSYFISHSTGKLSNSLGIETEKCGQIVSAQINFIASSTMAAFYFCMALWISWPITIAAIMIGGLSAFFLRHLIQISRQATHQQNNALKELLASITEFVNNFKSLKAMGVTDAAVPEMEGYAEHIAKEQRKEILSSSALSMVYEPLIAIFLSLGLYISLVYFNSLFAEVIFSAILFQRIMTNIGNLQGDYQKIMRTAPYLQSVLKTITNSEKDQENWQGIKSIDFKSDIKFEAVSFTYPGKPVLDHLSLIVPAHKVTTFLGPSGSGKTTCVDLICGLYQPQSGLIRIDGTPLSDLSMTAWRQRIGYVPQDPLLFNHSIACNVALSQSEINHTEVERALKLAGAWSFVQEKPEGIWAITGERGLALSGGQRQRIAIARALYRRPQLLIFDEATSALDHETEQEICQILKTLKHDVTILAISHRPALADISDHVIHFVPLARDHEPKAA